MIIYKPMSSSIYEFIKNQKHPCVLCVWLLVSLKIGILAAEEDQNTIWLCYRKTGGAYWFGMHLSTGQLLLSLAKDHVNGHLLVISLRLETDIGCLVVIWGLVSSVRRMYIPLLCLSMGTSSLIFSDMN